MVINSIKYAYYEILLISIITLQYINIWIALYSDNIFYLAIGKECKTLEFR